MYMPTPPIRGVGVTCTSRSRGTATAPNFSARILTTPVARKVTTAAVSRTRRSSRMGTPAPRPAWASSTAVVSAAVTCSVPPPLLPAGPEALGIVAENLRECLGRHRAFAQDARAVTREVDDRRCDTVLGGATVEIDTRRRSELLARLGDVRGGGPA